MPVLRRLLVLGLVTFTTLLLTSSLSGQQFRADRHGEKRWVLLIYNCDASDMPADGADHFDRFDPDDTDTAINGDQDLAQLEPIAITRFRSDRPLTLSLSATTHDDATPVKKRVRIFNSAGQELLGPTRGEKHVLTDEERAALAAGDWQLYAEGLQFAADAQLQLLAGSEVLDVLPLYVAPLLLLPDTASPVRNMVVRLESPRNQPSTNTTSGRYVRDFEAACSQVRASLHSANHLRVQVLASQHNDVWIQDEFQWGITYSPRTELPVVLHMPRGGLLKRQAQGLLAPGIGYVPPLTYPKANGHSMDYGGNLEVTPPVPGYPWGRVYYGGATTPVDIATRSLPGAYVDSDGTRWQHMHLSTAIQDFFRKQKREPSAEHALQEPIVLHTNWLAVGHADEMVSFIPANNERGFVLLYASPELGWKLLQQLPNSKRRSNNYLPDCYAEDYGAESVEELLILDRSADAEVGFFDDSTALFNERVDQIIRYNVAILQRELKLRDDEILPLPTLFCNGKRNPTYWNAEALTPGMVNMCAMDGLCLIPDPHIPIFRDYVIEHLEPLGRKCVFIDNWKLYHTAMGEVHCGSNTQRQAMLPPWWKEPTTTGATQ